MVSGCSVRHGWEGIISWSHAHHGGQEAERESMQILQTSSFSSIYPDPQSIGGATALSMGPSFFSILSRNVSTEVPRGVLYLIS